MRHRKYNQRLSRPRAHYRAALRNLAMSLLKYQKIKTTKAKAKQTQPLVETLIGLGKRNNLQSRRRALSILQNKAAVNHLFSHICPLFRDKSSGFSRIVHYSHRQGDGAELVFIELTKKLPKAKPKEATKEKVSTQKTPSEKAARPQAEPKVEEKTQPRKEKQRFPKQIKPKKFLGNLRRLFKKERDSL